MLWVLKRSVSMRRFFLAPKTYVTTYGKENMNIFTLNFLLSRPMSVVLFLGTTIFLEIVTSATSLRGNNFWLPALHPPSMTLPGNIQEITAHW